jgi:hypothetical protein
MAMGFLGVKVSNEDRRLLATIDGNLSRAVRQLIAAERRRQRKRVKNEIRTILQKGD